MALTPTLSLRERGFWREVPDRGRGRQRRVSGVTERGGVAAPCTRPTVGTGSSPASRGRAWLVALTPALSLTGEGVFEGGPRSGSGRTKKGVGGDGCGGVAAPCPRPTVGTGSSPASRGRAWFIGPHPNPLPRGEGVFEEVPDRGRGRTDMRRGGRCGGRALKQPRLLTGVASVGSVSADPNQTQLEPSGVLVGSLFFLLSSPDPCDKNTGYGVQLLRQYYRPSGRARRRFWLFTRTPG